MIQTAYDQLVDKICPCIVVSHSQGAVFAQRAMLRSPQMIKALVTLDPPASPDTSTIDLKAIIGTPQLTIFSDHIDGYSFWERFRSSQEKWRDAVNATGGRVDWVEFPKNGIKGNSHMMMDKNSDAIAAIVKEWLTNVGVDK